MGDIHPVVEVVSTNWETDYARKVEEYSLFMLQYFGGSKIQ
ncbi:hypothetical protein D0962_35455 [Leptolyngbyaceae cyanobacterium CCMR0082]|uniref:Uncharacterized protein n=1 Tax=Adonisia turfae CCMR0082 TaxID=2304604 RepID=A0A6M0SHK8_9CYAN|nr:hypothetical protein [Adonisia turfae CCMR0082]